MKKLVLLRHGQSVWNLENKFTGWTDVSLNEQGERDAHHAGEIMKKEGLVFDEVHSNLLKRCIKTTWIALEEMDLMWIPIYKTWRLNERHYGALQGLDKMETTKKEGEEQVNIWRRSFDVRPPELDRDDERFPGHDPKYADLEEDELPVAESLADTLERVLPYWNQVIVPAMNADKRVLITASHNSLRALLKHIEHVEDDEVATHTIPYGIPRVYEFDDDMEFQQAYFLGDPEQLKKVKAEMAAQTKH